MAINQFRGGRYKIEDIRPRFQTVATDNEYQVFFSINGLVGDEAKRVGLDRRFLTEDLGLYCTDAVLPGSSFADYETVGDRQGITERNPYNRIYDDLNLVFYIDKDYNVLKFFEAWIQFINPLYSSTFGLANNQVMKMNYPDDYKCEIVISKFNKNLRSGSIELGGFNNGTVDSVTEQVSYRCFRAWPLSVGAVPVSYQGINLLRCSVVFRYDRYIMSNVTAAKKPIIGANPRTITSDPTNPAPTKPPSDAPGPGSTETGAETSENVDDGGAPATPTQLDDDLAIWALSNQRMIENRNRAPVNLKSQDNILERARQQYPPGSAGRQRLLNKARNEYNFKGSF
jgi:hypothetical protein